MRNTKTPRFQQRHYELIAGCIQHVKNDFLGNMVTVGVDRVQHELLILFRADNPKFSPSKFNAACMPRKEPRAVPM